MIKTQCPPAAGRGRLRPGFPARTGRGLVARAPEVTQHSGRGRAGTGTRARPLRRRVSGHVTGPASSRVATEAGSEEGPRPLLSAWVPGRRLHKHRQEAAGAWTHVGPVTRSRVASAGCPLHGPPRPSQALASRSRRHLGRARPPTLSPGRGPQEWLSCPPPQPGPTWPLAARAWPQALLVSTVDCFAENSGETTQRDTGHRLLPLQLCAQRSWRRRRPRRPTGPVTVGGRPASDRMAWGPPGKPPGLASVPTRRRLPRLLRCRLPGRPAPDESGQAAVGHGVPGRGPGRF
nr:uncharacterized protein LOC105856545 isoform X4 [Microcebus murinus]